ncbi:hypothetical protein IC789_09150 [Acinetobacter seifertii]|uniref:Lipoprotein n=1 Tax=Acinetobacter seifertii TaxID=1530123 RepID=A0A7H2Q6G6_9GAMM|nr:hypothetical protein [Acinetobacter seifertii]MBD1224936.1 hypothetical protein [Acinetobacter seifertii]QNX10699.1 hypothetical protein IC794_10925 [Acinetobacter seifertii]QNX27996.1 hypothetical protein IC791_08945 [Acinetobacter seifertii]QNX39047.1 hypothetical protein IC789_09150 [Acinetobacter seifertii]QNX42672.1 hypothetical protein IC787_09035 [Acinetobacter seifertii]
MKKILLIALFSSLLFGCAKTKEEKLQEERNKLDVMVQQLVRNALKDGDSAKFRNQWELCGEVNAKNSFGAYTGFQRFIASKEKIYFENEYNSDSYSISAFNQVWNTDCKK